MFQHTAATSRFGSSVALDANTRVRTAKLAVSAASPIPAEWSGVTGLWMLKATSLYWAYSGHEVFVAGKTAMHLALCEMTGTAPDGTEIGQSGLSVAVL